MSVTAVPTVVRKSLGWSIVLSILMIVAGLLAIALPQIAGIAVNLLVGWLLVFSGGFHLVFAWQSRSKGWLLWELLMGLLYIAVGTIVLINPVAGLISLTLALAVYLVIEGALEFVLAVRLRPLPGSGWLFVDGVVTLILSFLIWRTWPWSSEWAIGVLVGVSMLFSGITRLMISLAARRAISALA